MFRKPRRSDRRALVTAHPSPLWIRCRRRLRGEVGVISAEYAVGTIAAVAFAGVLLKVLSSDSIVSAVESLISEALS